jgi:hypothetical protein
MCVRDVCFQRGRESVQGELQRSVAGFCVSAKLVWSNEGPSRIRAHFYPGLKMLFHSMDSLQSVRPENHVALSQHMYYIAYHITRELLFTY